MTYLNRNKALPQLKVRSGGGPYNFGIQANGSKYQNILDNDCEVTPYHLVMLLASLHQQKGLCLAFDSIAYIVGSTKLLKQYGPTQAVNLTILSAHHCGHPWSFKYILTLAETHAVKEERTKIGSLIEGLIYD